MWQNPELVFQGQKADEVYEVFRRGLAVANFPAEAENLPGAWLIKKILVLCQSYYKELVTSGEVSRSHSFNKAYRVLISEATEAIVEENDYLIMPYLVGLKTQMDFGKDIRKIDRSMIDKEQYQKWLLEIFVKTTVDLIRWLLGSEKRLLVGYQEDQPVWLDLEKPLESESEIARITLPGINEAILIGPNDLDLVRSCLRPKILDKDIPKIKSVRRIIDLLEDAYAYTHFTVDPEGAYVIVTGYPRIKAVTLKVKQPNERTLQILAKIDHDKGSLLFGVYDIMEMMQQADDKMREYPKVIFILYLLVQIYHDLVTAKQIRVAKAENLPKNLDRKKKHKHPRVQDYQPGFIYIPRVIADVERQPRHELPKAIREYTPRHVRGHFRRTPMSEKHRAEIVAFEKQYQLQVLVYLPEGCTYVRPHISPVITAEQWSNLPTYIKARIQDDIRLYLEDPRNADQPNQSP